MATCVRRLERYRRQKIGRIDTEPSSRLPGSVCNFGGHMSNTFIIVCMILMFIGALALKWFAHAVVSDFGIIGGLVAIAAIYCIGLTMDRYGL
jgi:membrane-associated PAP2 superfamily phosphatase